MSLRSALRGHQNSLGVVRLVLAAAVIFDHAFPLGGWGVAPFLGLTKGQQSLGGLAVLGFLAVSGYLVTKSAMNADAVQFLWRRFLRIFPAFWLVLLVGAFIVGPLIWISYGRPLAGYFSFGPDSPWSYLYRNFYLTIGQYQIWDLLVTTTPFGVDGSGGPINGSIWTLRYEFLCYLLMAGLLVLGVLKKAPAVVPAITGVFFVGQAINQVTQGVAGEFFPFFNDPWRLNFGLIFFIGATLAVYSDKIPFDHRFGLAAGVGSLGLLVVGGFNTVGYVLFAYFIFYAAAALPRRLQWIGQKNDYSYGIYLYGWVAQQVLAYLGVPTAWGYWPFVALSILLAAGAAWVSWHLVEKRAMSLKEWGPGRGVAHWVAVIRSRSVGRDDRTSVVAEEEAASGPGTARS